METVNQLMQQSAGVGAGIALGAAIGFGMRKRAGKTAHLIADSVFVTAAICGMVAMAVMMLITYLGGY